MINFFLSGRPASRECGIAAALLAQNQNEKNPTLFPQLFSVTQASKRVGKKASGQISAISSQHNKKAESPFILP
jgi:hypothetical protein